MPATKSATDPIADISQRIRMFRGQRVLIDSDLALLYGVTTARLNQQFRRNRERFPEDFASEIGPESEEILMLQNATSSLGHGGRRKPTIVFTEHGAIMAATILKSSRAVEMSVYVVRAFVKLREALASHVELARKLETLEKSVASLDANTRRQFEEVYGAILSLMGPTATEQ
jgi:ORF6N domain